MNNSVQSAISYGLRSLGYSEAMDAQCRVIEAYMASRDVMMVAPTGSGKSLIFQISPFVFDHLQHRK
jgi:superfamily II DNA helicase RecQ